jgi:Uma2 family endonuclease
MMASPTRVRTHPTLEEFLKLPEQKPVLEYIDGRIEAKAVPKLKHSMVTGRLEERINRFADLGGLGRAFPELRCTFAGRSIVPDVVFLCSGHIEVDEDGTLVDDVNRPPDIHVEIISPDQPVTKSHDKLVHATSHGCPLGWLIHPKNKTIDVYRPGQSSERLADDGVLDAEPVLPGFRLPVAEVFGWLRPPTPGAAADLA